MIEKHVITDLFEQQGFSRTGYLDNPEGPGSIIIAAFPIRGHGTSGTDEIRIAPFARANHYGEAVSRLKGIASIIRELTGLYKKDIRLFSNSPLPEKKFAVLSGLGFYGRNSLVITKEAGSRVVLAGMILPIRFPPDEPLENGTIPGALCGSCRNCMKACPTGAIVESGRIDRSRCLQSLATDGRVLPEEIMAKWGERLYGCTICQDSCPFNRKIESMNSDGITGDLSGSLSYSFLLTAKDEEIRKKLRGSALGLSWILPDYLRRNALLSLSFCRDGEVVQKNIALVERYIDHPSLGYAADWSLKKIRNRFQQR